MNTETSKSVVRDLLLSVILCACFLTFPLRVQADTFVNPLTNPSPAECLFNWAENNYPDLLAPTGSPTHLWTVYTYRYYPATNAYLGVNSVNNHVYYLGPEGVLQDVGPLADWSPKAGCPVPSTPPAECLFNWAELNYPGLFAPIGAPWTVASIDWTSRYYALTNSYLRIQSSDTHIYYQGPDGLSKDVGPLEDWTPKAACRPPVANAGPDQTAYVSETITLDGSASSDMDGNLITYQWTLTQKPAGSQTILGNSNALHPALAIDKPGTYLISLVVNDGQFDSAPATVTVNTQNSKPVANAGTAQSGKVGDTLILNGSASQDVDGDTLTYHWTLPANPQNSNAQLINPATVSPSLTLDKPGSYMAQLTVNDGKADSTPATVVLSTVNSKPVAKAGPAQSILLTNPATSVLLDGNGSSDADSDPLSFRWALISQPAGSKSLLLDPLAPSTRFTPDFVGDYVAQLIVNDGHVDSDPNTAQITVLAPSNHPPHISTSPVLTATVDHNYSYDVDAGDSDNDTLTYSLSVFPTDMSINAQSGLINWIPATGQTGPQAVTVNVIDGKGGSDSQSYTLTVSTIAQVNVPDLLNQSRAAAEAAIQQAKLTLGTLSFEHNAKADGSVINQSPAANSSAAEGATVNLTISLGPDQNLAPNPETVASRLDSTVATTTFAATGFLYSGSNPVQTGVQPGTIEAKRAAVISGKVLDRQNNPLPGVTISFLAHPEFGQTLSRSDGRFDMAVNGGGYLTVNYRKDGYLPAQRQVSVPWQDYAPTDDVVLIQLDSRITGVDLTNTATAQVARGNPVTDKDGTRQTTILFPAGTTATMIMADGSNVALPAVHVRATEYTVGDNGPAAMPAGLPATSGYTYAVEYSVDEAQAVGATEVTFNQPVISYNENFLNFPVGTTVPAGYYDRKKGHWIPQASGRIIKISAINNATADLIINNTSVVATDTELTALGVTLDERRQLAALYPVGQTLWRVPQSHFSPWDLNWSQQVPPDANPPNPPPPSGGGNNNNPNDPCEESGCIIGIEGQTLGEELDVTGTPYFLRYNSDRQQGRIASNTLTIPLIGASLSPSLKRIDLTVRIAGQLHPFSFPAQANQSTTFTWDGKDVYGRSLEGGQPAFIDLGYVYNATYEQTSAFGQSGSGVQISGDESRNEVTLHQTHTVTLGDYDARKESLGGWTLNAHHVYDPLGRVLYQGDGKRRSVEGLSNIITTAVNPQPGNFSSLGSLAVGPDGSFYYAIRSQIHKIDPNGNRTIIGGTGVNGFSGDGGLAVNAQISFCAHHLGLAVDGSLIFSEGNCNSNRIRRIDTNGIITTIAGSGPPNGSSVSIPPEGIPGTEYPLIDPVVRPAPDGSVYIADNSHLFRLGTDGRLRVISIDYTAADAGPNDRNFGIADFTVGLDGTIYLTDTHLVLGNFLIRKITPDGKIHVIAGAGPGGSSGDGGPALAATIFPSINGGIAVSPAGDVYFTEGDSVIRKISSDGIITQFAGNRSNDYTGDGGPANQASIAYAPALAFSPDGALYMADNHVIRRVGLPLPGYDASNLSIPSEDGSELFVFDATGRHLRTLNTLTGATLLSFAYDNAGRLITLTDGDNNVTTIERDSFGNPTGIVSPFNQRTQLSVNGNGYFSSITNPANETERFTYSSKGLLLSKTDPGNNPTTFAYDDSGRLISDKDALNSLQTLTQSGTGNDYTVRHQSALGRKADYQVQVAKDGSLTRIVTATDGTKTQSTEGANGINQYSDAEGTTISETVTGDPRWKMQSPYAKIATLSTGGLTATMSNSIVTSLSDPSNLLSLSTLTKTSTINNRSYFSQYTAANKTLTETSPLGRIEKTQIDNQGRPVSKQMTGLFDTQVTYDSRGRLSTIATGTDPNRRSTTIRYNAAGYVADITDSLGRIQAYEYDAAGRATRQTLTDGLQIEYRYDSVGNLTAITPPGRPQHTFTYNALSQNDAYSPPVVSNGGSTLYTYNLDQQLTQITRPDTQTLSMVYDTAGRIDTLKTPLGDYGYDYKLTTGQLVQLTSPTGGQLDLSYSGALLTGVAFSGEVTGSVAYSYDNDFRVSEVSVNGANPINYSYDNDSLLTKVGDLQFTRNSQNGLLTGSTLGVVTDSRAFNGFAETTAYQAKMNSDNTYKAEYSYDKLGRITQKIETLFDAAPITYTYNYDTAGRLSKVTKDSAETGFGYDSNGNRMTLNGITVVSYDDQDRLISYNGVSYTYTANGELKSKTSGGSNTNYQYDVLGNLRQVSFANGDQIDYAIDALDRRIGRKAVINGVTTEQRFLYQDGLKIIAELDGNNTTVSRFVYGSRVNVPDYMVKDGNTYRLITDHLGSPRVVINTATGAIAQRIEYDAWGKVLSDTNPGFQPFGFAGGLYDRQTGLVRFGARDYEAETGRWTVKDPIFFAGGDTNLYAYAHNDPINLIDPLGNSPRGDALGLLLDKLGIKTDYVDITGGIAKQFIRDKIHALELDRDRLSKELAREKDVLKKAKPCDRKKLKKLFDDLRKAKKQINDQLHELGEGERRVDDIVDFYDRANPLDSRSMLQRSLRSLPNLLRGREQTVFVD